jgi:hypothetical protein
MEEASIEIQANDALTSNPAGMKPFKNKIVLVRPSTQVMEHVSPSDFQSEK